MTVSRDELIVKLVTLYNIKHNLIEYINGIDNEADKLLEGFSDLETIAIMDEVANREKQFRIREVTTEVL
jgi:hypothetical protein